MISWLKYAPFHIRDREKDSEYKGPDFSRGKTIRIKAAGNTVSFRCPRHSSAFDDLPSFYLRDQDCTERLTERADLMANDYWYYVTGFSRGWSYWASWFRGFVGDLSLSLKLCARESVHEFDGISLLHPKGFEYALTLYLNARFGVHHSPATLYNHEGPLNWKRSKSFPVLAASFNVKPEDYYLVFPVSHKHFMFMQFSITGTRADVLQTIENDIQRIIDSVSIELSSETQAEVDKVKAQCAAYELPEFFPPFNWPIKPEDVESEAMIHPDDSQDGWLLED